jgi:hypothetical protein
MLTDRNKGGPPNWWSGRSPRAKGSQPGRATAPRLPDRRPHRPQPQGQAPRGRPRDPRQDLVGQGQHPHQARSSSTGARDRRRPPQRAPRSTSSRATPAPTPSTAWACGRHRAGVAQRSLPARSSSSRAPRPRAHPGKPTPDFKKDWTIINAGKRRLTPRSRPSHGRTRPRCSSPSPSPARSS